jgi:hypothetical protein
VAGALQSKGYHALVLRAGTSLIVGQNLGMRRHKATQSLRVFIVYGAYFVSAEVARLFYRGSVILWLHKLEIKKECLQR